ncbi:MAG: hypothetical protein RL536_311 [Candidatus Parcubacteria bacterium]
MNKIIILGLVCLAIIGSIIVVAKIPNNVEDGRVPAVVPVKVDVEDDHDYIAERVSRMTLDEKIGQMMIIGFENPFLDSHIKEMISKYHLGGVNLLGRNVVDKMQAAKLNTDLKSYNDSITDIPFMVATDQEGGSVSRYKFLKHLVPQTLLISTDKAYKEALERGEELSELGVAVNFSPVADYVTDKKSYLYARTFGTTTDGIVTLAKEMVRGYEDSGIRAVVKHFPGYGNISKDPHRNAAQFDDSDYYAKSLEPFRKLLENKEDGAVMTAHVIIPAIDSVPATLSSVLLKDILRKQWNYQGVIITDDLEMVSAGNKSVPDLAVEAIKAGNDMIISTFTTKFHPLIHQAIKKAVTEGEIDEKDIDASVERILKYKGFARN